MFEDGRGFAFVEQHQQNRGGRRPVDGGLCGHGVEGVRHGRPPASAGARQARRSEEHTSELQSLMRSSYAVFCLKKKKKKTQNNSDTVKNIRIHTKKVHYNTNNAKHTTNLK